MLDFGFHPDPYDLDLVISKGNFTRGLIANEKIGKIYDEVQSIRTLIEEDTSLPRGIYWFLGIEDALIFQNAEGPSGVSTKLQIQDWDENLDHPLIEALKWAEHFWELSQEVPKPKFELGDRVILISKDADIEIRNRYFQHKSWMYQDLYQTVYIESNLQPITVSDSPEEWVLGEATPAHRFGATLTRAKIKGQFSDTIYSYQATRTLFRPYQFKPVLKLLQSGNARILIADEVGLGKTIEAGLIWTELEARHEADRVLVVCPSVLVQKWKDEMQERFGFELTELAGNERERFLELHRLGRTPKRSAHIASLESFRTWKGLAELDDNPPELDLVIVDEAHSMRNTDTKSYELGVKLSEWTAGSNMVFLTATPINLKQTDLAHILGILDPADFEDIEVLEKRLEPNKILNEVSRNLSNSNFSKMDFLHLLQEIKTMTFGQQIWLHPDFDSLTEILSEAPLKLKQIIKAKRLLESLNTLSTTVTRTRRAEVEERKPIRDAEPGIQIKWNTYESKFYEEYLKWCAVRAKASKMPIGFAMQMPIRLASTNIHLAAQDVLNKLPGDPWEGDADEKPKYLIEPHLDLIKAARTVLQFPDTKLFRLGQELEELYSQRRQALLFTWSKLNLSYLQNAYKEKFRIAVLSGSVPARQRRKILQEFRAGKYDFVFANKVASEGLDFEFCSAVINYDLPWNPMEIEQRIGRIDRIGQTSEKILIRNFYNDEAYDSKILYQVLDRIQIFKDSIGELEPIIGQSMELLHKALDFTLTDEERKYKSQQFLIAIENHKADTNAIAESSASLVISSDVEIKGLEEELRNSGRYLGPLELANLIIDWATTKGVEGYQFIENSKILEIKGNNEMAREVEKLGIRGVRSKSEIKDLIVNLQNGLPINIALDQELSRTSEIDLISAIHPLVMAAVEMPEHRSARFATLRITEREEVPSGKYLVVLAKATNASRGGDEIWGCAVDFDGKVQNEDISNAILSSLALGELKDGEFQGRDSLVSLTKRAKRHLELKYLEAQDRKSQEEVAFMEARRAILLDQHERRMSGIEKRLVTLHERNRSQQVIRMTEGKKKRQEFRYNSLLMDLETKSSAPITLDYLATCVLEVVA